MEEKRTRWREQHPDKALRSRPRDTGTPIYDQLAMVRELHGAGGRAARFVEQTREGL